MILSKIKNILNNNNGMALIVALCVSTFIMALSLAVIYSTSQVSSNTNSKLLREEAQQQAISFADVLKQEAGKSDSEFYKALATLTKSSGGVGVDCNYAVTTSSSDQGYGYIDVTLCKKKSSNSYEDYGTDNWCDGSTDATINYNYPALEYEIEVTVKVTMKTGVYASVTDTYECGVKYDHNYELVGPDISRIYYEDSTHTYLQTSTGVKLTYDSIPDSGKTGDVTLEDATKGIDGVRGKLSPTYYLVRNRVATSTAIEFEYTGRD
jgi:hypothetical protein